MFPVLSFHHQSLITPGNYPASSANPAHLIEDEGGDNHILFFSPTLASQSVCILHYVSRATLEQNFPGPENERREERPTMGF